MQLLRNILSKFGSFFIRTQIKISVERFLYNSRASRFAYWNDISTQFGKGIFSVSICLCLYGFVYEINWLIDWLIDWLKVEDANETEARLHIDRYNPRPSLAMFRANVYTYSNRLQPALQNLL